MKLSRLNVEQYKNYSSIFECKILRYVDCIADFTHVQYAFRLRNHMSIRFALSLVICRYDLNEL